MDTMETSTNDFKQKYLIHILSKALLDLLEDNHGEIVHYDNRDFVVRKKGKDSLIIVEEVPHDKVALRSSICDNFIKIM
jgi:hypothetical protein